jgi:DNA repair protein SbcC/Rad50
MTPLKLEIAGFTCFKEKTVINFEDLELFAIAGPTGSGKSTLLDAMTYALYGQTPRLGSKGLDALMTPGGTQLAVQFEFRNASGTYRATRTLDKKPSGKIDPNVRVEQLSSEASWKVFSETEKIKEANAKLEQLVGLDYDGFTRAILLPQGAFDEFLRGDASKRRDLLVNLLSLDKVQQMQQAAGQRAKSAEATVKAINDRLEQEYAAATPERRRELADALETLALERDALGKRQETLAKEVKDLEALKALFDERVKIQQTLSELKLREPQIIQDRERLERARKVEYLLPQVKHLEQLTLKLQALQGSLESKRMGQEKIQQSFVQVKTDFENLNEMQAQRLPEIDEQLMGLAKFAPMLEQLRSRGGSLSLATQSLASQVSDTHYSEALWEEVQSQLANVPVLKQSEKAVVDSERDVIEAFQKLQALQQTVQGQEQQIATLTEEGKKTREAFNAADVTYKQAEIRDRAALVREHLHKGEACPVCEQLVQSLPAKIESNVVTLKERRDELEMRVEEMRSSYQEVKANLSANKERLTEQDKTVERLTTKRDDVKRQLEQLLQTFAEFGANAKGIEQELIARKRHLLISLAQQISEQTGGVDVTETQKRLQQEKRDLTEKIKTSEATFRQAEKDLDRLETELSALEKQLLGTTSEHVSSHETVQSLLAKAQFASAEEVKQAGLSEAQIKAVESQLNSYQSQKESSERRDVELQAKLSGKMFDEVQYQTLHNEMKQTASRLAEVQKEVGAAERDLKEIERMLEKAKSLRQELMQHHKQFETYRQLSLDLRGNEFQDFLLNQMQSKLAIRASHIIREVTEKRYDLRLIESEYHVLDSWTGETRSSKTLSGGETFIASLALALALSELLAGNKALGALFLDEGFGTLDAETLESVAEVLEHLSSEGRMVGLITHVQALAERLPARLVVTKSSNGSTVAWDM